MLLSLYVTLNCNAGLAQSATAMLTGTVIDQQGAVIAGAELVLVNLGTGLQREASSNKLGSFSFSFLPPGRYVVKAHREGFATAEVPSIVLNVNDHSAITIRLQVSPVSQSVIVREEPSTVDRQSNSVNTLIDREFVAELPLNGRSFDALIALTPGMAISSSMPGFSNAGEPGQFTVNGQRPNTNYFMVDGVGANVGISPGFNLYQTAAGTGPALSALGSTNTLVSVDALQEFRIQTSTYAAEFGRTPGAQISILTRSGSNEFHGSTFNYFRHDAMDANDWFANSRGLGKAPLRQNDFGGVLGGPLRRNRTFFFSSYEGLRLRLPAVALTDVPSVSLRQNAVASVQPLLKAFPVPNGKDLGGGLAEFSSSFSNPSTVNAVNARLDHSINNRLSLFGRYSYSSSDAFYRGGGQGYSLSMSPRGSIGMTSVTLGVTRSFDSKVSNDLRMNYSRNHAGASFLLDNFGGATPPSVSALFPSFVDAQNAAFTFNFFGIPWIFGPTAKNFQRQLNVVDNLAVGIGRHELRFGIDYRRLAPILNPQQYAVSVLFDNSGLLSGDALQLTVTANKGRLYPVFTNFSSYAQDTWQLTPKLTATYGVRWELNPPPHEANGNDPFTVRGLDDPATMTLAPQGTPFFATTYGNFAPRVSLAYRLHGTHNEQTVLRGGFGIFFDLGTGALGNAFFAGNYPNSSTKQLTSVHFPLGADVLTPLPFQASPPYQGLYVSDPHLQLPRTYQGHVTIEHSFDANQSVSLAYVGAVGRKLLRDEYWLNPNSSFPGIDIVRNSATSDYQAMQVQFQRRLSRGFQAVASYTWSHSIDTDSLESTTTVPGAKIDPNRDRGSSDYDIRHVLSAAATYDIPGLRANLLRPLLRGWSVDALVRMNSATVVNPVIGPRQLFGITAATRPDLNIGVPLYIKDATAPGGMRLNRDAFSSSLLPNQQGTLGRNALRGFGLSQTDMAVRRQFGVTERVKLHLRAEAFNLFNHPNFGRPFPRVNRQEFGRAQGMLNQSMGSDAGLNPLYQVGGPRSMQLTAKLIF
jgi:hypothetical protein